MIRFALSLAIAVLVSSLMAAGKPVTCSLTVSQLRGESHVTKSGGRTLNSLSSGSSNSGTTTIERSLKWKAEVRFRNQKPAKVELKAYHIGCGNGGKTLTVIGKEAKAVELDADGRAAVELTSPKTRLTKTRSRTSSGSSGFSSSKSRVSGERMMGCVVQVFGDGALLKSWSSDPRWSAAAETVPFSVATLAGKSGRIGE